MRYDAVKRECEDLKHKLEDHDDLSFQIQKIRAEKEVVEQKLLKLEWKIQTDQEIANSKDSAESVMKKKLRATISKWRKKNVELAEKVKGLEEELTRLRELNMDLMQKNNKTSAIEQGDNEDLGRKNRNLRKKIAEIEERNDRLENEMRSNEHTNRSLKNYEDDEGRENKGLWSENMELKNEIRNLNKALAEKSEGNIESRSFIENQSNQEARSTFFISLVFFKQYQYLDKRIIRK